MTVLAIDLGEVDPQLIRMFWSRVPPERRVDPEGCWIWGGAKCCNGTRATFFIHSKAHPACRWLWAAMHGPIPATLVVRHKCDVPLCVNPAHHELGTEKDNQQDRERRGRGRQPRGEKSGKTKFKDADVLEMRRLFKLGVPDTHIAARFKVSSYAIWAIRRGKVWKHVQLDEASTCVT